MSSGGQRMVMEDGTIRHQRALTAAAMTIDLKDRRVVKRLKSFRQDWQQEAWSYYRTTPLVGFGSDFTANAMSRLRFYIGWQKDVSDWPSEIDPDNVPEDMDQRAYEVAQNLLVRLNTGQGLMEMARKAAYGLTLPGEVVVLGREEIDPVSGVKGERFDAYSTSEIDLSKADRGEISVRTAPMGQASQDVPTFRIDPGSAWFFRVWRPDPEYGQLAATPMQRILEACEEQGLLRRYMRSTYRSRLNAGIFEVPSEWQMGPSDNRNEGGEGFDKLTDNLVQALMTAVADEASAATVVPYVIHAPMDTLGKARHITFDRTFDDRAMEMRRRLDEEIASGMDLPDQVMLGLGDVKFRNAEVITKEQFKLHLEPLAIVWVRAITVGFLLPLMVQDGIDVETAGQFVIWYDPAAITSDPDQASSSNYGYDRAIISAKSWRNVNHYTDEDAPDDEEIAARQEGIPWPIVQPNSGGAPPGAAAPNPPAPAAVPEPAAVPDQAEKPAQGEPAAGGRAAAGLVAAGGTSATRPLVRSLGRRMAIAEIICRSKVQQLADQAMRRGFERIGAATRTKAQSAGPHALAMMKDIDNRAVLPTLGPATVLSLGVHPQHHIDIQLGELQGQFREAVGTHQHRMLAMLASATGTPVERLTERAAARLAQALDHAWGEFEGRLNKLAHDELFLAMVAAGPQRRLAVVAAAGADARLQGEFDATVSVPAGLVREVLSIAGGVGNPSMTDPDTMGGVSSGPILDDLLDEEGVGSEGFEWLYGDSATRTRPFEPHENLGTAGDDGGGVVFLTYTDDVLANFEDFPQGSYYFPGDHAGCQCEASQRLFDTVGKVPDPVSPSGLQERGFAEAPIGEAEVAKSRNVGAQYPSGKYPVGRVPEPKPFRSAVPQPPARMTVQGKSGQLLQTFEGRVHGQQAVYHLSVDTARGAVALSDEQAQAMLETLRRAHVSQPAGGLVPSVRVVSDRSVVEKAGRGAMAYVDGSRPGEIVFSSSAVARDSYNTEASFMPMARTTNPTTYTLWHEYGHVHDFGATLDASNPGGMFKHIETLQALFENSDVKASLSLYGQSNRYEAYAESFAEWNLSGGQTTNLAAQTYAKAFGWQTP